MVEEIVIPVLPLIAIGIITGFVNPKEAKEEFESYLEDTTILQFRILESC